MTILFEAGDGIRGKKIGCEFRDMSHIRLGARTATHRGQRTTLDDAFCVIERPYEWVKTRKEKTKEAQ